MWVALTLCFNHTGPEILAPCMSYWAYFKEVVFGIFHARAVDNIILFTLQNPNPFVIQHLGNQGEVLGTNSWCQLLSQSQNPFQLIAEGSRKFSFPAAFCIILKCWVVCWWVSWSGDLFVSVLFYRFWRMREELKGGNSGRDLPRGFTQCASSLQSWCRAKNGVL